MAKLKGFISETLVYGFGNVFSRLFAMFLIPLYAKYLGKIDYSNLVMLQSGFAILTFFTALNAGVFFYYYEYENRHYRKIVLTSWFYYQLAVSVLLCIAMFLVAPHLYKLFAVDSTNTQTLKTAIVLLGIQLFPYIFNNTTLNYFRIERQPKKAVTMVLLEALFTLISVFLVLSVLKAGLVGVLVAQILSRAGVTLIFLKKSTIYVKIKNFSQKLTKKIFVYSYPFILSSIFTAMAAVVDKFVGAQVLSNKHQIALLALAMQLVLPVTVLADMIRMAIGPYVMSIRKDSDADKSYQQIFDITIFSTTMVVVGIVLISPFMTILLTDKTYIGAIYIVPLMAYANIFSLAATQFAISFSLIKKTLFILYSIIISVIVTFAVNMIFMGKFGVIVGGVAQIVAYMSMAVFLYYYGRKKAQLKIKLNKSLILLAIITLYIVVITFSNSHTAIGNYYMHIVISVVATIIIAATFLKQQNIALTKVLKSIREKA